MLPEIKGVHKVWKRLASGKRVRYHLTHRGKGAQRFWTEPDDGLDAVAYVEAYKAKKTRAPRPDAKTVGSIARSFLTSGDFKRLSNSTKAEYRRYGESFEKAFNQAPAAVLEDRRFRGDVAEWRDQWIANPRAAQYAWSVARRIANWAQDRGMIGQHVIAGVGVRYKADRAELVWTPADIAAFNAVASEPARRLLTVAIATGLRAQDLARFSRAHVKDGVVQLRTSKRNAVATIPILPDLQAVLDATPRDRLLILHNERDEPFNSKSASKMIRRWATRAGVDERLHLHDIRGTTATRLVRANVPIEKVSIWMGWDREYAIRVVANYVALDPENMADVVELLEKQDRKQNVNL